MTGPRGVAAISAMKPSKPAAFQRASTSRSWPGASAITAPPPPAPVSLAPIAPAARAVCTSASSSGPETRSAHSRPCAASNVRPSPSTSPLPSAAPASSASLPSAARMSSATDSRSRRRATAATCAAVSRGRPDSPTHSRIAWYTGTGRQPPARENRPATPLFAAAASIPDGLPWKIASASSTAASIALVVRRAPARRRRRARHRHRQRRRAAQARARRHLARRRRSRARALPAGARSPPARARPRCRRRPSPRAPTPGRAGARCRAAPSPRSRPTARRPAPDVRTRPRARRPGSPWRGRRPCTAAVAAHPGLCASHCASSPVITRGAAARSRARATPPAGPPRARRR